MFGKIIAGLIGGLVVAIFGSFLVVISAGISEDVGSTSSIAFFIFWATALVFALIASRPAKSWRRMFIFSGLLALCLPLASIILTGRVAVDAAETAGEHAAAAATGAAIGGGLITLMAGFVGLFLGAIFLIMGLLIGRDKQVVVVQQSTE